MNTDFLMKGHSYFVKYVNTCLYHTRLVSTGWINKLNPRLFTVVCKKDSFLLAF